MFQVPGVFKTRLARYLRSTVEYAVRSHIGFQALVRNENTGFKTHKIHLLETIYLRIMYDGETQPSGAEVI